MKVFAMTGAFQPPHQKSPDSNRIPRRPHPTTSPSLPMITTEHTSTPTQDHVTSAWFLACTHLTSPHKTSGCSSCQWRGLLLRLEPATSLAVGTWDKFLLSLFWTLVSWVTGFSFDEFICVCWKYCWQTPLKFPRRSRWLWQCQGLPLCFLS